MQRLSVGNTIRTTADLILKHHWEFADETDMESPEYLPECRLQLRSIVWNDEEDDNPYFEFSFPDDPSELDYPEFSFEEIKAFLRNRTFLIE